MPYMAKIARNLTDLIGNTPLLELGNFSAREKIADPLIAKLEYFNPAGSVKDRIGLAMIQDAEEKGLLKKGNSYHRAYQRKYRDCPGFCGSGARVSPYSYHA